MSQYYEQKVNSILSEKEQLRNNYEKELLKMSSIHVPPTDHHNHKEPAYPQQDTKE